MKNTHILPAAVLLAFALAADAREPVEQDTISIKGDRALPNTLYITPWKEVGEPLPGEMPEKAPVVETEPLEPELFQRELELYREGYSIE